MTIIYRGRGQSLVRFENILCDCLKLCRVPEHFVCDCDFQTPSETTFQAPWLCGHVTPWPCHCYSVGAVYIWLPLTATARVDYKLCLLVHKITRCHTSPTYWRPLPTFQHDPLHVSENGNFIELPTSPRINDGAFSVAVGVLRTE